MSQPAGHFVWFDLMTTDPEAARAFYTDVIGWGLTDFVIEGAEMPPYRMWVAGEAPVGGSVELPEEAREAGAPPHWLAYITTPDADASATRVEELGGRILHTEDVPTVGRIIVCMDPAGAAFSLFTPAGDGMTQSPEPQPGQLGWAELGTRDKDSAADFYGEIFGWTRGDVVQMEDGGDYQLIQRGTGYPILGMWSAPEEMHAGWLLYFCVADIDASIERMKSGGGTLHFGPMEVPGGARVAGGTDPQGAWFAIIEIPKG